MAYVHTINFCSTIHVLLLKEKLVLYYILNIWTGRHYCLILRKWHEIRTIIITIFLIFVDMFTKTFLHSMKFCISKIIITQIYNIDIKPYTFFYFSCWRVILRMRFEILRYLLLLTVKKKNFLRTFLDNSTWILL